MPDDEVAAVRNWVAQVQPPGSTPEPALLAGFLFALYGVAAYVLGQHTDWFTAELNALVFVAFTAGLSWRLRTVVTPVSGLFRR